MNTELIHDNKRRFETNRLRKKGQFLSIGEPKKTPEGEFNSKRPSIIVQDYQQNYAVNPNEHM